MDYDHADVADVEIAFEGTGEGYIMIYSSKYKWFPTSWGRWFPQMMRVVSYPVSVQDNTLDTKGRFMVTLQREEEE